MQIIFLGVDDDIVVASYPLLPSTGGGQASPTHIIFAATPAGAIIPVAAQAVIAISSAWSLWVRAVAPGSVQATSTLVQDAGQVWWAQIPISGGAPPVEMPTLQPIDANGASVLLTDGAGNSVIISEE